MSSGSSLRGALIIYSLTAVLVVAGMAVAVARYEPPQREPVHLSVAPVASPDVVPADPHVLRVCADPNDLPYSNQRGEGFENAIASLVAAELQRTLHYVWQPQRRAFIRNTLSAGVCDVVIGVPEHFDRARTTAAYYRSSYVFVERRGQGIGSIDDERLRGMRIGVQIVGEDYDNPPPVQALALRGLADRVRGYTVYGDYSSDAPQQPIIDGLVRGDIDVAIAWGPLAGFFASRSAMPLVLMPVNGVTDPRTPFTFGIAMAAARPDSGLVQELDRVIERRRPEIRRILERFNVPLVG